ncbi:Chryptochrome 1 [Ephemera danica]|nr:Chryptochrome 1 [Ephemera danica]
MAGMNKLPRISVLWFRHGLRLHDNPALLDAIKNSDEFYPIFIFDGESAGTRLVGYNRMRFLLEALADLDRQLRAVGGQLYLLQGSPSRLFQRLWEERSLTKLCFEQDCEPIWHARDAKVRATCIDRCIHCNEHISHTLWDPKEVIRTNGGSPPLTYQLFLHTVSVIGDPPRPVADPDWSNVKFGKLPEIITQEFKMFACVPSPEHFGLTPPATSPVVRWVGGETQALKHLQERLQVEEAAFMRGVILPNRASPDLLAPPTSQSAALRFGCLSVRREGWMHHVARNSVACFLTRGALWQSWEHGLQHFLKHLIDADWSVCAGNWMWVSSSSFEQLLDCSQYVCPVNYGRRRYVPELRRYPVEYLYEPWKAPLETQQNAGCIIGEDYPERIVDHTKALKQNRKYMQKLRDEMMEATPDHCCPSNEDEVLSFMQLPEACFEELNMSQA